MKKYPYNVDNIPQEISIYVYQLQPTDYVSWYGSYYPVTGLKGTYKSGIGLAVAVSCARGTCIAPYNLEIEVLRTY